MRAKLSLLQRVLSHKVTNLNDFTASVLRHREVSEVSIFVDFPPVYRGCDSCTGAIYFHYFTISLRAPLSFGRFVYYDENVGDGFDELLLNATMLSTNKKLAGTAQKTIDRANEISQKLISKLDEIRVVIRNPVGEVQSASSVVEACLEFCKDPSAMSSYVGMFRAMKEAEES